LKRMIKIEKTVENNPFNKIIDGNSDFGIIASGLTYAYVEDTLRRFNLLNKIPVFKLATTFPLPNEMTTRFITNLKRVLIVEELEPFVELHINALAKDCNPGLEVIGKKVFPRNGEITPEKTLEVIGKFTGNKIDLSEIKTSVVNLPPRPPVLCAGCPHRGFFYALKAASKKSKLKFIHSSDIGCYTLGFFPPLETIDTCLCMGGSIGMANGLRKAGEKRPIFALLGDSTFFHSGIPSLANCVYNGTNITIVVLDNLATAMTGFQPHPGTGVKLNGELSKKIKIEDIAKSFGVEFIEIVDNYDLEACLNVIMNAIDWMNQDKGPALIIARHQCALLETKGKKITPYYINLDECNQCRICLSTFGCPAITTDGEKIFIEQSSCTGCGLCAQICPQNAIKKRNF
ncbi:MAG: thiamine pyrophosphate-dependent enzyme, partial [Candidatus Helarchaeota archaeon]